MIDDRWGLTLWPPALRVLDELGVGDEVRRRGATLSSLCLMHADGREMLRLPCDEIGGGGSYAGALPSAVQQVLAAAAREAGVRLRFGTKVLNLEPSTRGTTLTTTDPEGRSHRLRARVVVAADGPGSLVRRLLGLRSFRLRIPGQKIYSGIGGALRFRHLRQAAGNGWALAAVPVSAEHSWFAATVHGAEGADVLRRYARDSDPEIAPAVASFREGGTMVLGNGIAPRWEADGVVLMGEAVPHHGAPPRPGRQQHAARRPGPGRRDRGGARPR